MNFDPKIHMPLVLKHVNRIGKSVSDVSLREDMIQAGCLGVLRAMKTYVPEKGSFGTYAGYWIRYEIEKMLKEYSYWRSHRSRDRCSGVSLSMQKKGWSRAKLVRAIEVFYAKNGRDPEASELDLTEQEWEGFRLEYYTFKRSGESLTVITDPEYVLDFLRAPIFLAASH